MTSFDPGAPEPDAERIARALEGILRELQGVRQAMETLVQEVHRWARRPPLRPPDPSAVRSRR